ncbi:carbohydrate ABC transporter permease [Plantactinospora sp. DSM 117369]
MRERTLARRLPYYVMFAVIALFAAIPLYWLVLSSIKPVEDLSDPSPVPARLTLDNYLIALTDTEIPRWLGNTLLIAIATTALGLAVSALAAFSFARHVFAGRSILFGMVIASLAIPEYVTVIPQYTIMRELGLLNTYAAVVLPLAAHALTLFLLRQYFRQLPDELFDAARLDGASEWSTFLKVAFPLIRPGLGAAGLMLFLSSWNAYLLPLIMLQSSDQFTLPMGLAFLHSQIQLGDTAISPWSAITAGTVLSILPLVVCLLAMQRHFIAGITQGAVR